MKPVLRSEILGLGEYEAIRERFLARIILEKRSRRVRVCEDVGAVFENRDTVLFQIQEILRTERITKEASIQHELDTYTELVPGDDELSATMFVEIPDAERRERMLVELAGLEARIALEVAGKLVRARNESRSALPDRTTAVHYLKFRLGKELAAALREAPRGAEVFWVLDHPKLSVRTKLGPDVVASLAGDLA